MESLFISSLFNIIYAIALGIIGYILYGMSKNAPKTSEDKENMQSFLQENNIQSKPFYPVTNATIFKKDDQNEEDKIDRNFNITWIEELPEQNDILQGEWFDKNLNNGISISDDISDRYELEIGDEVFIKVGEEIIKSYVQSTRTVNWDNFSPNFFIIGHPSLFKYVSSTYKTSFYIVKNGS